MANPSTYYAVLLALVMGCGKKDQPIAKESPNETPSKGDDNNSTTAKPVKELTLEEKVIGEYEVKKKEKEAKWKLVDGEIHIGDEDDIEVVRIKKDGSLLRIAKIDKDRKREGIPKEHQFTVKKIKSSTNAPPPERSLEVQFLDGELNRADLEEVTKLDLDGCQLTELPKNLENLTQLKVLVLSKNQLAKVPKGLEKLTKLERLDLDNNQLTSVKGLEKLTKLKMLWLFDNKLTDVKGLEKLTKLPNLDLSNNPDLTKAQIAELQKALPKCKIHSNPTK